MLLAIFSIDGYSRLDELVMDGIVCCNNFWIARLRGVGFVVARLFALLGIFSLQNNTGVNTMQTSGSGSNSSSSSGNTPMHSKSNNNNMTNMKGMDYIIINHGQNQEWFVI